MKQLAIATGYSYVSLYFIHTIATQLLHYKSCVFGHQYKSSCVPAVVVYTVFTMLRALIFPSIIHYPTRDLLRRLEAVSRDLHYHINNSCNTGTSALPDMYARRPRASADISGNAQVPVLQLIRYTSGTLKICPNLLLTALPIYIAKDSHCNYGILILTFL